MSPQSLFIAFLLVLSVAAASAQTHMDVGFSVGAQSYEAALDNPRVLTSAEVLVQRRALGFHVAVEYADLSEEGALIALHPDLVYRLAGESFFAVAGVGPTFVSPGSGRRKTWNVEVEAGFRWRRAEVFGRVRQYDYDLMRDRGGESGPNKPAAYVGARFRIR
jgi:hypothetical protein